jgi:hypothetical protein
MRRAKFYENQGMHLLKGYDNFFIGNIKQLIQFDKLKNECEEKGLKPLAPSLLWLLDQGAPEIKDATGLKYDAGKTPNVLFNTAGSLTLMIGDPAIVQEMLVTKNA